MTKGERIALEEYRKENPVEKSMTFSKIILIASNCMAFFLTAFYCFMVVRVFKYTGICDFGNLMTIILAFIAEISVSNGFYYWKSKREFEIRNNIPKEES